MSYLAYHFIVEPPQPGSEILIALLADMGFESFDQKEKGFTAFINETENARVDIASIDLEGISFNYEVEQIANVNWNAEWEKNFEPVVVEDLLCVRAPFHVPNTKVKHEIVIMPKMSFGTGHHQTTRLMCLELFTTDLKNKRVLDMGSGTGILAILASKLGATDVLGIDIDAWCVENGIENCAMNGHSEIHIKKGDIEDLQNEKPFDLIIANINKNILMKHLPVYAEKVKKGGLLFLSGFFTTDIPELSKKAQELGFTMKNERAEEEWAMVSFSQ